MVLVKPECTRLTIIGFSGEILYKFQDRNIRKQDSWKKKTKKKKKKKKNLQNNKGSILFNQTCLNMYIYCCIVARTAYFGYRSIKDAVFQETETG